MKKAFALVSSLCLVTSLLAGCGGADNAKNPAKPDKTAEAVKTGFAVISSTAKSTDAGEKEGLGQVDSTVVAVTVNKDGKIVKCVIDGIQTKINFSAAGKITTDLKTEVKSKTELGTAYGMGKVSSIGKEWSEQAKALSDYIAGKTVSEIKGIAVNEKGAPSDKELASSVTISIGGYIAAIEKAAASAKDLGAKSADKLGVGTVTNISKSTDAGDKDGVAQAYSSYAVATFDSANRITSCIIDGSQTDVKFTNKGKITSDLKILGKTKTELGSEYGMAKVSSIGKEWFEQADALSKYVVGKTIEEVKGIAVNEKGAPSGSELKSSVTISIGGYVAAIEKAKATAK